jgi:hypothetical protein
LSTSWQILALAVALTCITACGVPKEFVNQETQTAFNDTVSVAAHVKMKCGAEADTDAHCVKANENLLAVCKGLDELAQKAGHAGFDCATWKPRS